MTKKQDNTRKVAVGTVKKSKVRSFYGKPQELSLRGVGHNDGRRWLLTKRLEVRILFAEPFVSTSSSLYFWLTAAAFVTCDIGQNESACAFPRRMAESMEAPAE
jgi:hypothetical protein